MAHLRSVILIAPCTVGFCAKSDVAAAAPESDPRNPLRVQFAMMFLPLKKISNSDAAGNLVSAGPTPHCRNGIASTLFRSESAYEGSRYLGAGIGTGSSRGAVTAPPIEEYAAGTVSVISLFTAVTDAVASAHAQSICLNWAAVGKPS
jgi:hypothetical protein